MKGASKSFSVGLKYKILMVLGEWLDSIMIHSSTIKLQVE